jgi:hypothetical protein
MAQAKHDPITRRALLSGAAAVPAVLAAPVAALAAPAALNSLVAAPDPIFAAIAAHARAYADINGILDDLATAEQAAWNAPRGARRAANKRLAEVYATERRFGGIERDATARFVKTIPQTLGGAAAALRYVREHFEEGYSLCEEDGTMALLASTECAICKAAGLPVPLPAARVARCCQARAALRS